MKSIKAYVAVGVILVLFPGTLLADCPDITSHGCCSGFTWKTYTFDLSCGVTSSGNVGTTTSCGMPMHRVAYPTTSTETVTYQYTIPSTSSNWEIRLDHNFYNGGDTSNFAQGAYVVTRGGSTISSGPVFYTNTSASCTVGSASGLSWTAGDILTVTITMRAATTGAYAEVRNLILFKIPA